MSENSPRVRLLENSLAVTIVTVGNLALSFLTQVTLASLFGVHAEMDSFLAATTLPTLGHDLLLGAFNFALVPLLVELQLASDESHQWRTFSHLFNCAALILGMIGIVVFLNANSLIALTNPGFGGAQLNLTVELFHITWASFWFTALADLLTCFYYSRHRFVWATGTQVGNVAVVLLTVVVFARVGGIYAAAWGTLIGATAQFLLLIPLFARPRRYSLQIDWANPLNRRALTLMAPLLIGGIFYKATGLTERFFASMLGEGSISFLNYAFKVAAAIELVIAQGIAVTFLPLMSAAAARGDREALRATLSLGLRSLTIVSIPVMGLVLVLSQPVVGLLFQRGAFSADATGATARALVAYLGWVWAGALGVALTNAFYALKKQYIVVFVGSAGTLLYLGVTILSFNSLGYLAPAVALSLMASLNALVFILLLRRELQGVDGTRLARTFFKSLFAGVVMTALVALGWTLANPSDNITSAPTLALRLALVGAFGLTVYFALIWIMRVEEIKTLARSIREMPACRIQARTR